MSVHEQFAEDLALHALGSLQGEERAALEKHLEGCTGCRRELEQLRGDMALMALSTAGPVPPRRARQRLLEAVAREPRRAEAPARRGWWMLVPWAAAAALAVGLVVVWLQNSDLQKRIAGLQDQSMQQLAELQRAREVVSTRLRRPMRCGSRWWRQRNSAAAAGESDLCSRPVELDFPGQQLAGIAAAEGL